MRNQYGKLNMAGKGQDTKSQKGQKIKNRQKGHKKSEEAKCKKGK